MAAAASTRSRGTTRLIWVVVLLVAAAGASWWAWRAGPALFGFGSRTAAEDLEYYCPMHPEIVSDQPGKCSICQMDLVPRSKHADHAAGTDGAAEGEAAMPELIEGRAPVTLGLTRVQQFGVVLETVEERSLTEDVRAVGQVVPDEARLSRVRTKVSGWIEQLYVNKTGQPVRAGDRMLDLYSPEVVSAQEEYLLALDLVAQTAGSPFPDIRQSSEALVRAARRRLDLWDIPASELRRLETTREVRRTVTLQMPFSGHVHELLVKVGDRVEPETTLYVVADFSQVWINAQVYEHDLSKVFEGQAAQVAFRALPDRQLTGRVDFVWPHVEPETRTTTVRVVVPNPAHMLKSGMYGDVTLVGRPQRVLAVPQGAVVDTGMRQFVFVYEGTDRFAPREIRTGRQFRGYYEVLEGLAPGEQVVTEGNYMIDSESRIRGTALRARALRPSEAPEPPEPAGGHQH